MKKQKKTRLVQFRVHKDLADKITFYQESLGLNITEICIKGLEAGLDVLEAKLAAQQVEVKALADMFDCGVVNLKVDRQDLKL